MSIPEHLIGATTRAYPAAATITARMPMTNSDRHGYPGGAKAEVPNGTA